MSLLNLSNRNISTNFAGNFTYALPQMPYANYYSAYFTNSIANLFPIPKLKNIDASLAQYMNILNNIPKFPSLSSCSSEKVANLLREAGYDNEKGKLLTQAAQKRAREHNWTGYCARAVRHSFEETHLASGEGNGHAYQYADTLSRNRNFKEIDVSGLSKAELKELSKFDGITYVYDRGVSGYSRRSGHIEVSLGNGTNGSDGITHNIRLGARVFIPVKTSMLA